MRKLKAMAEGLGAREFRARPWFPDPYTMLNKNWSMAASAEVTDDELVKVRSSTENDGFCITNDGFCTENDGFCIKNDGLCI